MPPEIFEGVMAIFAMLSIGGIVLAGMKMQYHYKSKMLDQPKNTEDVERLVDAMDSMYEQTRSLREEIAELQERLDFHERMLARPREENRQSEGR